jgi:hypothetical protein
VKRVSRCNLLQRTSTQLRKLRSRKLVVAVVIPLVALTFGTITAQQGPEAEASAQLSQGIAESAHEVALGNLPQFAFPARRPVEIPLRGPNFNPTPTAAPTGVAGEASPVPEATNNQTTPGTISSFLGKDESACGFFIPSDHALATSGSYEVQVLNSCITVFNTSGVPFSGFPKSLNAFFGAPSGDAVGDPRALYDWLHGRFIVMAEDFSANNIVVAASQSSNPTLGWNIYTLSGTSGGLAGSADFPMLGQTVKEIGDSNGAIYVSFDRFNSSGAFVDDVVWILPKTQIYAGTGFSFNIFFNLNVGGSTQDHVQPANVMSRGDQPDSELLINTFDFRAGCSSISSPCNGLVVWAIHHGIGSGAALTGKVISTANNYAQPFTAAQPGAASGTSCAINTGFVGITGGVTWSAGDLYAAATSANFTGNKADGWIYWQVHPYLDTSGSITNATIRNEIFWGKFGFGSNSTFSEYYPAPQPDDEGNVTVVYNFSSNANFPSTGYVSQRTTRATGSFPDGGLVLASGSALYCQRDRFGRNRWGDYTATSPFGSSIAPFPEFWFAGQFSEASTSTCSSSIGTPCWGTRIGKNGYSTPAAQ